LLPSGFALGEWLGLMEAAVQSQIGERRILVVGSHCGAVAQAA
jgi:hypothetical protein